MEGVLSSFSPSGTYLAVATADGKLRVFDAATGRLQSTLGASGGLDGGNPLAMNGHLTERHTCMTWASAPGKAKKKRSTGALLVVGNAAGDVKAYDTQLGELKWARTGVIDGGIQSLVSSSLPNAEHKQINGIQEQPCVYACGARGQLLALSLESGDTLHSSHPSKHGITAAAVSPDGSSVLCAGSSMILFDLKSQERTAKFTGHTTPARVVTFAPHGEAAASAAGSERSIALWSLPSHSDGSEAGPGPGSEVANGITKGGRKDKGMLRSAAGTVSLQEPAVQLDAAAAVGSSDQGSGSYLLAALTQNGQAYVWHCAAGQQGGDDDPQVSASLLLHARVKGAGRAASQSQHQAPQEGILSVRLQSGGGPAGAKLLVAFGSSAAPTFQSLDVPDPESVAAGQPATVILRSAAGSVLLPSTPEAAAAGAPGGIGLPNGTVGSEKAAGKQKKQLVHRAEDITILGPENGGAPPLLRTAGVAAAADAAAGKRRRQPDAAAEEEEEELEQQEPELEVAEEAEAAEEGGGEEEDSRPLGERVAALEAAAGGGAPAAAPAATQAAGALQAPTPAGSQTADSLAVMLTQALRSNDASLLEKVLSTSASPRVIRATIANLLAVDATAFLRVAVDRLLSKPSRAVQLAPWIRTLLHHHTGYIMAAPGAQAPLASLYQAIDSRVSLYAQLLKLVGRLSLVTAHARARGAAAAPAGAGAGHPGPEVVFEDDDDDEEVAAEDPFAPADVSDDDADLEDDEDDEEGDLLGDEDDDDLDEEMVDGDE